MNRFNSLPKYILLASLFLLFFSAYSQKCKPYAVGKDKITGVVHNFYGGDLMTYMSSTSGILLNIKIEEIKNIADTFVIFLQIQQVEEAITVVAQQHFTVDKESKFRMRLESGDVLSFSALNALNTVTLSKDGDNKGKYYVVSTIGALASREEIKQMTEHLIKFLSWDGSTTHQSKITKNRAKKFQANVKCFWETQRDRKVQAASPSSKTSPDSKKAKLYGELGVKQAKEGNFEKAVEFYDKALKYERSAWVVFNKAFALLNLGMDTEAAEYYKEAIPLFQASPNKKHWFEQAIKYTSDFLTKQPDNETANKALELLIDAM